MKPIALTSLWKLLRKSLGHRFRWDTQKCLSVYLENYREQKEKGNLYDLLSHGNII